MPLPRRAGLLGCALLLLVPGCSSDEGADPRFLVATAGDGGMDAQVTGTLRLNDKGCLALDQGVPELVLVVWPDRSTPLIEGDALVGARLPDGTEVRVGQSVAGGGGYSELGAANLGSGAVASCGVAAQTGAALLGADEVVVTAS